MSAGSHWRSILHLFLGTRQETHEKWMSAFSPFRPLFLVLLDLFKPSVMYRTDGKPIEDREVPHLIEMGFRELQERPVGAPPDATEDELKFFKALDAALFVSGKPKDYKVLWWALWWPTPQCLALTSCGRSFYSLKRKRSKSPGGNLPWPMTARSPFSSSTV